MAEYIVAIDVTWVRFPADALIRAVHVCVSQDVVCKLLKFNFLRHQRSFAVGRCPVQLRSGAVFIGDKFYRKF